MQSLSELKEQNRLEDEALKKANHDAEETVEEVEEPEEVPEEVEATEEESDDSEESDDKPDVEPWMQSDDDVSPMFKSSDIKAAKTKLRAKLERKHNEETESLKAEIEELKQKVSQPAATVKAAPSRPKYDDFDTDEAYEKALDEYYEQKIESKLTGRDERIAQESKVRELQQKVVQSVDQHYERAEKLLTQHGIDPDVYRQADENVRRMADNVMKGKGDQVIDQLISRLGGESEKVFYYVGKNINALNELQSALVSDPSGLEAAMLLGQMKAKVSMPEKRQSKAPKPPTQLNGDESSASSTSGYRKKYLAAHKSKDAAKAFTIRREAKKAGVDVSKW